MHCPCSEGPEYPFLKSDALFPFIWGERELLAWERDTQVPHYMVAMNLTRRALQQMVTLGRHPTLQKKTVFLLPPASAVEVIEYPFLKPDALFPFIWGERELLAWERDTQVPHYMVAMHLTRRALQQMATLGRHPTLQKKTVLSLLPASAVKVIELVRSVCPSIC